MTRLFVTALVAFTSFVTYLIAVQRSESVKDRSFGQALSILFECVGSFAVFLTMNICLGIAVVLTIRSVTTTFVSLYMLADVMLVILSMLQGFAFQLWWRK